jgi:hypothetical protein
MGGIYEAFRYDALRSHDIYTKFHKDLFRHSKFDRWGFTDTQKDDLQSLLLFFQNEESKLKIIINNTTII